MITHYVPKPEDLAWAREALRIMKEGGIIATSVASYQVSHAKKTVTLVAPHRIRPQEARSYQPADPWDNPITAAMHHRHCCVFGQLGYKVLPEIEDDFDHTPPILVTQ